jgi:cytochrome c-type biogenesis protein CcmE
VAASRNNYLRFTVAIGIILVTLSYLAYTGVQESKSYYVTIAELRGMGDKAYSKRLRVAGNVVPGSIKRQGTRVDFLLQEETRTLAVTYKGTEAPPDTFKDDSQAMAEGEFGRDGVFHAKQLQAKCASKYAPKDAAPTATPARATITSSAPDPSASNMATAANSTK